MTKNVKNTHTFKLRFMKVSHVLSGNAFRREKSVFGRYISVDIICLNQNTFYEISHFSQLYDVRFRILS